MKQLKHEKKAISQAPTNTECGISLPHFNDILEGDVVECFEYKRQTA